VRRTVDGADSGAQSCSRGRPGHDTPTQPSSAGWPARTRAAATMRRHLSGLHRAASGRGATSGDHELCRPAIPDPVTASAWSQRHGAIPLPLTAESLSAGRPGALDHGGLDLCPPMFAPCLLGCPGTGRQDPVLMSLRLAGLRYSSPCHSIPVTRVFKKVPLSSGLLIRGFGVQVPGGAPGLTWGFRPRVSFMSGLVGPGWVRCGASPESAGCSGGCRMLEARLSCRVGVVRSSGLGENEPRAPRTAAGEESLPLVRRQR
jgi:hypothetical protein